MSAAIVLDHITKTYGSSRGIQDVSLSVAEGTIYGFLGPNGAGKTTTISLIVDLLRPTHGSVSVFGKDARMDGVNVRKRIGYLAGDMALDGSLTGLQQLQYFGAIRGSYDRAYVHELAERLDCQLNKRIKHLSRGNKQKIGLMSALMHRPDLLVLDEPTSGLDPLIQEQFNEIILEHKKAGKTTFISSHILSEVQELCDHVAFIREGTLLASQPVATIRDAAPYVIQLTSRDKKLRAILDKLPEVSEIDHSHQVFSFTYMGNISKLMTTLGTYKLDDISISRGDLEAVFMHYYRDEQSSSKER